MAPQICLSRRFFFRAARGCISSVAEMGWEELDPLKWGTGAPQKHLPRFPTPKPPRPSHPSQTLLILLALLSPACAPAPSALWEQDIPGSGPGTPMGCSSARPRTGILLQPLERCRSGDSWECEWGSGFAEARPPGQGGNRDGGGRGEGTERLCPCRGNLQGGAPPERLGAPPWGPARPASLLACQGGESAVPCPPGNPTLKPQNRHNPPSLSL